MTKAKKQTIGQKLRERQKNEINALLAVTLHFLDGQEKEKERRHNAACRKLDVFFRDSLIQLKKDFKRAASGKGRPEFNYSLAEEDLGAKATLHDLSPDRVVRRKAFKAFAAACEKEDVALDVTNYTMANKRSWIVTVNPQRKYEQTLKYMEPRTYL